MMRLRYSYVVTRISPGVGSIGILAQAHEYKKSARLPSNPPRGTTPPPGSARNNPNSPAPPPENHPPLPPLDRGVKNNKVPLLGRN